jgi:hypothetical protein
MTETFTSVEHTIHYTGFDTEERRKEQFEDIILLDISRAVRDVLRDTDKALHDYLIQRFGGYLRIIKSYTELYEVAKKYSLAKDVKDIFDLSEYDMSVELLHYSIEVYLHNSFEDFAYEKYKQWREINGQIDSESEEEESATTD